MGSSVTRPSYENQQELLVDHSAHKHIKDLKISSTKSTCKTFYNFRNPLVSKSFLMYYQLISCRAFVVHRKQIMI